MNTRSTSGVYTNSLGTNHTRDNLAETNIVGGRRKQDIAEET